jgi:hypothetical protein
MRVHLLGGHANPIEQDGLSEGVPQRRTFKRAKSRASRFHRAPEHDFSACTLAKAFRIAI